MRKKIISLFICICLAASSFQTAAFGAPVKAPSLRYLTSSAGVSVTDASYKSGKDLVFNIQDLHFNVEAQKKIAALLSRIAEVYPSFELYMEGASKKSDFSWLYSSMDKKNADAFIQAMLDSGNLTGAEYFAAKNSKEINPLEDRETYIANLILFAQIIENRSEILKFTQSLETNIAALRGKYFSYRQNKLFENYSAYRLGLSSDDKYFKYLKKEAEQNGVNINDYPNVALFCLVSDMSASVSQKKLQRQTAAFFENAKNLLSYKDYSTLTSLANTAGDRQSFIVYLYQNREKLNLSKYPQLNNFVNSLGLSDKLNQIEFLIEENALAQELVQAGVKDENAANILFLSQFVKVYENVLCAQATPYEYEYYKRNLNKFKTLIPRYFSDDKSDFAAEREKQAEKFNDANLERNHIFVDKMFSSQKPSQVSLLSVFGVRANAEAAVENSANAKVKAVVAGGFHTSGITDLLNGRQISNVSFTPNITSQAKDYPEKYIEYAKALSQQSSAINRPALYEMEVQAFVKAVADGAGAAIAAGLDAGSLTTALKAKSEIADAYIQIDEENNKISVKYFSGGIWREETAPLDRGDESAPKTVTTLGEMSAVAAYNLLNYDISDALFLSVSKILFNAGASIYGEKNSYQFAQNLSLRKYGAKELLSFLTPALISQIIVVIFEIRRHSLENKEERLIKIRDAFKSRLERIFDDVSVTISDTASLMREDGWCFAALSAAGNSAALYVHKELLDALAEYENIDDAETKINALIAHEIYERDALKNESSPIYESFGEYLRKRGLSDEIYESDISGRNAQNFHKYLQSDDFETYISEQNRVGGEAYQNVEGIIAAQKDLLDFSDKILNSVLTRHLPVETLEVIDESASEKQKEKLLFLRLEDEDTIKEYAKKLEDALREKIKGSKDGFAIVFRKTFPENAVEKIVKIAAENLGIEIVYIEQDDYMNDISMSPETRGRELKGRMKIQGKNAETEFAKTKEIIYGKDIFLIADTYRTGALVAEETRVVNELKPKSVLPLALIDISQAVFAKDDSRQEQDSNANNLQEYFFKYFIEENTPKLIESVIKSEGRVSKYFYRALYETMSSAENRAKYSEKFGEIIRAVAENDKRNGRRYEESYLRNIMNDLIAIAGNNWFSAGKYTGLAYYIYREVLSDKKSQNPEMDFINWINENRVKNKIDAKKITNLTIGEDVWEYWKEEPFTLIAYALLEGYDHIDIKLDFIEDEKEKILQRAAKRAQISVVEEFKDEKPIRRQVSENEKELLKNSINDLSAGLAELREAFNAEVLQNADSAAKKYEEGVKRILLSAREAVARTLSARDKEPIRLTDDDYSILLGGSITKGGITSGSDVYYNILSRDKHISQIMENNFVPLFEYALSQAGIDVYMSEGNLDSYIGSSEVHKGIPFLGMMNISDSRAVATFLDYRELKSAGKDNGIFKKFIEEYDRFLGIGAERGSQESQRAQKNIDDILSQIGEVIDYGIQIVRNRDYAMKERKTDGKLTFSQNLYAASYRDTEEKGGEVLSYRWHLRTFELMIKYMVLSDIRDNPSAVKSVSEISKKSVKELLEYLADRGVISSEQNANLYDAWYNLKTSRQKKSAMGPGIFWTQMFAKDREAFHAIEEFIEEKEEIINTVNVKQYVVDEALKLAYSLDDERFQNAQRRVEHYSYMLGFGEEYHAALLLADFDIETLKEQYNPNEKRKKEKVLQIVSFLQSVADLPSFDSLEDDSFALQNYMNLIISAASQNPNNIIAVFSYMLEDMLSSKDKLAGIEGELEAVNLQIIDGDLKIKEARRYGDLMREKYLEPEINKLKADMERLEKERAEAIAESEKKIKLFYTVFVPVASRLGFSRAFEYLRNMPFVQEHPSDYMNAINDIRYRLGFNYSGLEDILANLESGLKKGLSEEDIEFDLHSRIKTIYSVYEKVGSVRGSGKSRPSAGESKGIDDGLQRETSDIVRIGAQAAEVQDLMGFHIVVKDVKDREKAMKSVKDFFAGQEDFKIVKDKYDSESDKGFTRYKYTISYNEDPILEIVIFSELQYKNEVYAAIPANAVRYAIAHVYYKLGDVEYGYIGDYFDNVTAITINFNQ
ncbi:MAG: hypothetical protein LBO62_05055, partial [Endomicrobium sp.]|nr:hypothetical protein [Endomicrobium sp.]